MEFKEGTIIKGKDLKGQVLCKILRDNMIMKGFQYHVGENIDVNPLATEGSCKPGLHFCLVKDVCRYLDYGTKLSIIEIPDEEDVYVDVCKLRTHRLVIKEILSINEITTWKYLVSNAVDITVRDNYAIRWAAEYGNLNVLKYLHKNGADIKAENDDAIKVAAEMGHLDVVKYLVENGADIAGSNNYAIRLASGHGHLDVVKYLVEKGADITADNNCAIKWAVNEGHSDVAIYLVEKLFPF